MKLKYQTVLYPEGTVAIHETTIDDEGNVTSASYDPVRLEATSAGELEMILRQVYRSLTKSTPISIDDLETLIYKAESMHVDDDLDEDEISNVVSLVDYFSR